MADREGVGVLGRQRPSHRGEEHVGRSKGGEVVVGQPLLDRQRRQRMREGIRAAIVDGLRAALPQLGATTAIASASPNRGGTIYIPFILRGGVIMFVIRTRRPSHGKRLMFLLLAVVEPAVAHLLETPFNAIGIPVARAWASAARQWARAPLVSSSASTRAPMSCGPKMIPRP